MVHYHYHIVIHKITSPKVKSTNVVSTIIVIVVNIIIIVIELKIIMVVLLYPLHDDSMVGLDIWYKDWSKTTDNLLTITYHVTPALPQQIEYILLLVST